MPYFMDRHETGHASPDDIAKNHLMDLEIQAQYGVTYLTYWFDFPNRRAYCLVEAPDEESCRRVHAEAHGDIPNKIIDVEPATVAAFLGRTTDPSPLPIAEPATRTVVFTDMVGSTEHLDRFGDDAGMAVLREHNALVRDVLSAAGGREVKHTGDGFMLAFDVPSSAVRFAVELQKRLASRADELSPIHVRIGIHAGEPVADGDQLFGTAVNLAARLCERAPSGGILVSHVVKGLTMGKPFKFLDQGTVALKGFSDPVAVAEVDWRA